MNTEQTNKPEQDLDSLFTILPMKVILDTNLQPNAKILYSIIVSRTRTNGYAWASNKHFADIFNVSKGTISVWINTLVKEGYIVTDVHTDNSREIYLADKGLISKPKKTTKQPITKNRYTYNEKPEGNNIMENDNFQEKDNFKENDLIEPEPTKKSDKSDAKASVGSGSTKDNLAVNKKGVIPTEVKPSNFFDIPTEPEPPKTLVLTEKQKAIIQKRNKQNKIDTSAFKTKTKVSYTKQLSEGIKNVIALKIVHRLEDFYTTDVMFEWTNAARLLHSTMNDSRYAEIKDWLSDKYEMPELNLLVEIIDKNKTKDFFVNKLEVDNNFTFGDKLIYSILFDKEKYNNSIDKLYKYYRTKERNITAGIEKQILNEQLKNSNYKSQIGG